MPLGTGAEYDNFFSGRAPGAIKKKERKKERDNFAGLARAFSI